MQEDFPKELSLVSQLIQAAGIMAKNNTGQYIPLRLAYYPFTTTIQIYDQLTKIQKIWQKLVFTASKDSQLVIRIFEGIAKVDPMINRVFKIYKKKLEQIKLTGLVDDIFLLFRGDYFLNEENMFKLIQYNLVAVSMSSHSQKFQKVRKSIDLNKTIEFPQNTPLTDIGINLADMYKQKQLNGLVLIVVCYEQKNVIEHGSIMMELLKYGIRSKRQPLCHLTKKLKMLNNTLYLDDQLVSIVYYRTGYMPNHFCENQSLQEQCWKVKQMLQLSNTIKIPNITMDLMNQKRMQTELSKPEVYSKYLNAEETQLLQQSLVQNWDFDNNQKNKQIIQMIKLKGTDKFVLKPNLEGGGNNIYSEKILQVLQNCSQQQRKKYILMEKIVSKPRPNIFFQNKVINKFNCHYELSRFGIIYELNGILIKNMSSGYLVRAKPENADESRVMLGVGAFGLWAIQK